VETAAVLKEIAWLAERSAQPQAWRVCRQLLIDANFAPEPEADVPTLPDRLRQLALTARRVCLPSIRTDEERGNLAEEVARSCGQIAPRLWDLLGPLNRTLAGFRAMEIITRFLDAVDSCGVEYNNLRAINSADLRTSNFDAEGDTRLRWLLPPRGTS
jgi:hypothetical protein